MNHTAALYLILCLKTNLYVTSGGELYSNSLKLFSFEPSRL